MKKIFIIVGILFVGIAVFAKQLGIDNDEGWGRGRVVLLELGLVFILMDFLFSFLQDTLMGFKKKYFSILFHSLNFSRITQIFLVSFIATIIVIIAYSWFTQPNTKDTPNNYNYYSELAIGFKMGHLYLTEEPSPALLSLSNPYDYFLRKQHNIEDFPWDVSLYNNNFYTYWGPAPSLILTIFSHKQLSFIGDYYLALTFACGLFLYAVLIMSSLWHKSFLKAPVWILGISLLVIGFSAPITIMLKDSRIYEAAILGCQFFFMGGCYWAHSSIGNDKLNLWKLVLASIHWAFALGTRITILPVILFSTTATIIYIFRVYKIATPKSCLPILAVMGAPLLLALSGLSLYNWARFESIFEFGLTYQLTNVDYNVFRDSFSNHYIVENLYNYFAHPIQVKSRFPYIARVEYLPSNDRLAGLLYISPYILLLFAPLIRVFSSFQVNERYQPQGKPRTLSSATSGGVLNPKGNKKSLSIEQAQDSSENLIIIIVAGSAFIAMAIILSFYFVTIRYIEDFMPSLIILITIQLGREYQLLNQTNAPKKLLGVITVMLAIITITASFLLAIPNSGITFMVNLLNSISKILGLK